MIVLVPADFLEKALDFAVEKGVVVKCASETGDSGYPNGSESYAFSNHGFDMLRENVVPVDGVKEAGEDLNAKLTSLETVNVNLEADLNHAITCFDRGCQRCASVHRKYHPEIYEK